MTSFIEPYAKRPLIVCGWWCSSVTFSRSSRSQAYLYYSYYCVENSYFYLFSVEPITFSLIFYRESKQQCRFLLVKFFCVSIFFRTHNCFFESLSSGSNGRSLLTSLFCVSIFFRTYHFFFELLGGGAYRRFLLISLFYVSIFFRIHNFFFELLDSGGCGRFLLLIIILLWIQFSILFEIINIVFHLLCTRDSSKFNLVTLLSHILLVFLFYIVSVTLSLHSISLSFSAFSLIIFFCIFSQYLFLHFLSLSFCVFSLNIFFCIFSQYLFLHFLSISFYAFPLSLY